MQKIMLSFSISSLLNLSGTKNRLTLNWCSIVRLGFQFTANEYVNAKHVRRCDCRHSSSVQITNKRRGKKSPSCLPSDNGDGQYGSCRKLLVRFSRPIKYAKFSIKRDIPADNKNQVFFSRVFDQQPVHFNFPFEIQC